MNEQVLQELYNREGFENKGIKFEEFVEIFQTSPSSRQQIYQNQGFGDRDISFEEFESVSLGDSSTNTNQEEQPIVASSASGDIEAGGLAEQATGALQRFGSTILKIPKYVTNDVPKAVIKGLGNLAFEVGESVGLVDDAEQSKKLFSSAVDAQNTAIGYQAIADMTDNSEFLQELDRRAEENFQKGRSQFEGKNSLELIQDGDYGKAGKSIFFDIVGSLPQLATMVTTGGVGLAAVGLAEAAQATEDLIDEGVDPTTAAFAGGGIGLAEAVFEKFGSVAIFDSVTDLITKVGKDQAVRTLANMAGATTLAGGREFLSEHLTGFSQEIINDVAKGEFAETKEEFIDKYVLNSDIISGGLAGVGTGVTIRGAGETIASIKSGLEIKDQIREDNPNLNKNQVSELTKLEKERRRLKERDTRTSQNRLKVVEARIDEITQPEEIKSEKKETKTKKQQDGISNGDTNNDTVSRDNSGVVQDRSSDNQEAGPTGPTETVQEISNVQQPESEVERTAEQETPRQETQEVREFKKEGFEKTVTDEDLITIGNGRKYSLSQPITLKRGTRGKKNPDGTPRSAHPNVVEPFAAKDEKIANRYKADDESLIDIEVPAGTTVETVRIDTKDSEGKSKELTPFRAEEETAINNSDAQIVKLITTDATGKETQYVIKDPSIFSREPLTTEKPNTKEVKQLRDKSEKRLNSFRDGLLKSDSISEEVKKELRENNFKAAIDLLKKTFKRPEDKALHNRILKDDKIVNERGFAESEIQKQVGRAERSSQVAKKGQKRFREKATKVVPTRSFKDTDDFFSFIQAVTPSRVKKVESLDPERRKKLEDIFEVYKDLQKIKSKLPGMSVPLAFKDRLPKELTSIFDKIRNPRTGLSSRLISGLGQDLRRKEGHKRRDESLNKIHGDLDNIKKEIADLNKEIDSQDLVKIVGDHIDQNTINKPKTKQNAKRKEQNEKGSNEKSEQTDGRKRQDAGDQKREVADDKKQKGKSKVSSETSSGQSSTATLDKNADTGTTGAESGDSAPTFKKETKKKTTVEEDINTLMKGEATEADLSRMLDSGNLNQIIDSLHKSGLGKKENC